MTRHIGRGEVSRSRNVSRISRIRRSQNYDQNVNKEGMMVEGELGKEEGPKAVSIQDLRKTQEDLPALAMGPYCLGKCLLVLRITFQNVYFAEHKFCQENSLPERGGGEGEAELAIELDHGMGSSGRTLGSRQTFVRGVESTDE